MSSLAIGIDLGTTNSAVSVVRDGVPTLLADTSGNVLLPSVVAFDAQKKLLVGRAARNQILLAPERAVKSVKRSMGTSETFPIDGRDWTPTEISAVILRSLVEQAASALGERPTQAVITVPAFFSDLQRQATRDAGEMAGLEVLRLVNEPTAAALTYQVEGDENVIVFDLGGGTFDVSVLEMGPDFAEVRASRGDTKLGGDDIDLAFAELIAGLWGHPEVKQDRAAWSRLTAAAERAKIALSERTIVRVQETWLLGDQHLDLTITREQLEEVARPIIEPTLKHIQDALTDAKLSPSKIQRILLVGGQTRMPLVREIIEESLDIDIHSDIEPDQAVSLGAGLLAARLTGQEVAGLLVDVTPHTLVAGVRNESRRGPELVCLPIIPRNTVVPVTRSHVAYTLYPGQPVVHIPIGQGEQPFFNEVTQLGQLVLEGLDTKADVQPVEIRFHLDASGVLTATAVERITGREAQLVIADSPYALAARRRTGGKAVVTQVVANTSAGAEETRQLAERLLAQADQARGDLPEQVEIVRKAAEELRQALGAQDNGRIERLCDELADRLLDLL